MIKYFKRKLNKPLKTKKITINKIKLEESLKEAVEIEKEFKEGKRKGYNNAIEMLKSIFDNWF